MNIKEYIDSKILINPSRSIPTHQYNTTVYIDLTGSYIIGTSDLEDYKKIISEELARKTEKLINEILKIEFPYHDNSLEDLEDLKNLAKEIILHVSTYYNLGGSKSAMRNNNPHRLTCNWYEVPHLGILSLHKKFGLPYGYLNKRYFIGYYNTEVGLPSEFSFVSYRKNLKKFNAYCIRVELPFPDDFEIVNELLFNLLCLP